MKTKTTWKTSKELREYLDALEAKGSALYKKYGVTDEVREIQDVLCGPLPVLLDDMEARGK